MTTPSDPNVPLDEADPGPEPALPSAKALPLQLGGVVGKADALSPIPAASATRAPRAERDLGRLFARAAGTLVVVGVAAALAVAWVLPWYVRRACIDEAAAHGILLTIRDANIRPDGFRLDGVRATSTDLPGAIAEAPEVDVATSHLQPHTMIVRGATLTLDGRWASLSSALSTWRDSAQGGQAGAWAPASLVVDGARVAWKGAIGENANIEADDVHVDVAWGGEGTALHARSDRVAVLVPRGPLGPWRVDIDRVPGSSRVRVALDPQVPESCTILVLGDDSRTTSIDLDVPRSPLARLGVGPQLLGLRGKDAQVEALVHFGVVGSARADASAKGEVFGIDAVPGLPAFGIAWEITATGDPLAGLDLKRSRLAIGPLVGALTGTLKTFGDGFRVDLAWAAGPVPCAAFDAPLGPGQPFDIAYALRKLVEATGRAKVDGTVSAIGRLSFDSRDLGTTTVDFAPTARCRFALSPF